MFSISIICDFLSHHIVQTQNICVCIYNSLLKFYFFPLNPEAKEWSLPCHIAKLFLIIIMTKLWWKITCEIADEHHGYAELMGTNKLQHCLLKSWPCHPSVFKKSSREIWPCSSSMEHGFLNLLSASGMEHGFLNLLSTNGMEHIIHHILKFQITYFETEPSLKYFFFLKDVYRKFLSHVLKVAALN